MPTVPISQFSGPPLPTDEEERAEIVAVRVQRPAVAAGQERGRGQLGFTERTCRVERIDGQGQLSTAVDQG